MQEKIRNIAIIAHVDHGKTTLIDKLLQQSGTFKNHEETKDRILDSNDLEKERGITILAKNISINWKGYKINIIDTPGHADFGGEVERVISMVDSVLLVVDALDGPMPQTRFVTQKAFENGIKPIVVINKIDRKNARPDWVVDQIFDLFVELNATDEQLDFPIIYTSALLGTSGFNHEKIKSDMTPLYETIIKHVPAPQYFSDNFLQMQISQLEYNNYLGIIGIGRIIKGTIKPNQTVSIVKKEKVKTGKVNKILSYVGLTKKETSLACSGDIVALTGLNDISISDTICDPDHIKALPRIQIEDPTVKMMFCVNTSTFSGIEGKYITAPQIFKRLKKEAINNVALRIEETLDANIFCVSGRGELHLSILIENMRREGFELEVSRPKVILKKIKEKLCEPLEKTIIEINQKYQGSVMSIIGERKGELKNMISEKNEKVRLEYIIPSRALIGFRSHFMNITSGTGLFYSSFSHYDTIIANNIGQRRNGVMIANKTGTAVGFSLFNLQDRGNLFISHGEKVYEGQIIGIHNRNNDLTVNCLTGKKLTNMRASGTDEAITLIPPLNISLEYALGFINDDELVEVTPKSIRIRKKYLTESSRKSANRKHK
ncbi:translational GTPase TypA [Buchnera aphidicola]|uniref:translational GTPase TypA n=1 Tax=Buchnera aphidicola TaxID=9 RepID=UPI0034638CA3